MMVCVAIPNQVYAAGKNKEAALTVEQTVKGKTNGVTDEFQYELTSLDSGNPMPEGSTGDRLKFSLNGNENILCFVYLLIIIVVLLHLLHNILLYDPISHYLCAKLCV